MTGEIDEPSICESLFALPDLARSDRDFDGLNECEERLMGTDPSLSDTDGDNLPDGVELRRGTDHLNPDSAADFDEDGVSNGDEIKEGTDPRSIDEAQRLGLAARYTLTREGRVRELQADELTRLEAARLLEVSPELSPGLAALQWMPAGAGDPEEVLGTLALRSPQNNELGEAVPITRSGQYRIFGDLATAAPLAPVDDEEGDDGIEVLIDTESTEDERVQWVDVEINVNLLPDVRFTEDVLIRERERSCMSYVVRNLRLVEVEPSERDRRAGRTVGANEVLIYFAQKTSGQSEAPGRFRIARLPIYYRAPDQRSPGGASLEVEESEFVSPSITLEPTLEINSNGSSASEL